MYVSNKMAHVDTDSKDLVETVAGKEFNDQSQDEDIAITGMAGKFPESDDIYQFRENLYNKIDLITEDDRRWKSTNPEIPQRTGKLNDIFAFDAGFFGISSRHANNMDIFIRMMLEKTHEVIADAGYHPSELVGTKTGVFIAASSSDSESDILYRKQVVNSSSITGTTRSMIAHHVSYFFRLQGPSYTVNSACSSALYSLEHAYRSIKEGICDNAIVGALNQCLNPNESLSIARIGVLSPDGRCKSFDNNADGYVRSEAAAALFLQKSKDARRIYAHILHSKLNSNGYKEQGIAHPSSEMQAVLMKDIYRECNVNLSDVSFLEAHGTGTNVGDLHEINAITDVFCSERETPLYIGSVKSNMGHTETASGLGSIIKVLIGMEYGYIPPNLNYFEPRQDVDALIKGRLKVITEKTPWPQRKAIAGVNSLAVGGSNGHVVFQWNEKLKVTLGLPQDEIPRLLCASGRTKHALNVIWDDLANRSLDSEFVGLLQSFFERSISNHPFRGYQILSKDGEIQRSVKEVTRNTRKLLLMFNTFEPSWSRIGKKLVAFPMFMMFLEKIRIKMIEILDIDIISLLKTYEKESVVNQMFVTMAVQICLASILKMVGLIPNKLIGLGTGELIVAYLEGHLNLNEVIYTHLYVAITFYDGINTSPISDQYICHLGKSVLRQNPDFQFQKWLPLVQDKQNSPEYLKSFRFEDVEQLSPNDCEILVIGPPIKNLPSLIREDSQDFVLDFLTMLGRYYENGYDLRLRYLYPKITWPVSRGTPMISPLIRWDHTQDWYVPSYENKEPVKSRKRTVLVDMKSKDWSFISGHVVNGRILFPASGFLFLVWETLAQLEGKPIAHMKIIFEDVKFIQSISLTNKDDVELLISTLKESRTFEISERNNLLVTGTAYEMLNTQQEIANLPEDTVEYLEENITLKQAEIYRKLKLKGYEYKGEFKARKCKIGKQRGLIKWTGNWITFLDNMIQTILDTDNRNLCVPASIEYVLIDPITYLENIDKQKESETLVPVHTYYDFEIIRSRGIEFRKINKKTILKGKNIDPLLETYGFVPNITALSLGESIRIIAQIIVENNRVTKFKSAEVAEELQLISPYLKHVLDDLVLNQTEIRVLSEKDLDLPGITFLNRSVTAEKDLLLAILPNALEKNVLQDVLKTVKRTNGYVLTRQSLNFDVSAYVPDYLDVLCIHTTDLETLILLRKSDRYKQPVTIELTDDLRWMSTAKDALKQDQKIIFYSQNSFTSGILGLVNCLRKETNGDCVSCFFIMDNAPEFDLNHPFFKKQFHKRMAFNVWKDGQWGTYRHLRMKQDFKVECRNSYANVITPGDLSSFDFIQDNPYKNYDLVPNKRMISVYWTGLNFKDIVIATGRTSGASSSRNVSSSEFKLGLDFSGRDIIDGKRVMGFSVEGALSTRVIAYTSAIWTVPEDWSLEDAATVPWAYLTAIYALLMKAKIKRRQSILIHSAAGDVGQAAINIAIYFDCNIFLTVGTQEKRNFLRSKYPQIKDAQIGNSRDTSFEQMVACQTQGRGVDIVLNSLSQDTLAASMRCLAQNGVFLEMGIFDLEKDNNLELRLFEKNISFHSVMVDFLFSHAGKIEVKQVLHYFADFLSKGIIKPLPRTIFGKEKIADAFKLMATRKHIGKILLNIRKGEEKQMCSMQDEVIVGLPRYYCDPEGTYVIIGGLGGFGLELANWLIQRGSRKLVLSSRTGLKTGYQAMMLRTWKSCSACISIRTDNIITEQGCTDLISYAESLGPVIAIFNLAMVLKNDSFLNQTVEDFTVSLAPKATATKNLDAISRLMCPQLRKFVVFSSITCGKGMAEVSSYGMANSIMERICENRKTDGYPALAIQWGAIGDVGVVADAQENSDTEITVGGYSQQKMSSCVKVLDIFLRQKETIVSSAIINHKRTISGDDIFDVVLNILGVTNLDKLNQHSTFAELGMDSITKTEIRQILERELELFFTSREFTVLTVAKLQDLLKARTEYQNFDGNLTTEERIPKYLQILFSVAEEGVSLKRPVVRIGSSMKEGATEMYVLPGMEGTVTAMKPLIQNLNLNTVCVQYTEETIGNTVEELTKTILPHIDIRGNTFVLLAHSFGCLVAMHLAYVLENSGLCGKLIFVDGAPKLLKIMCEELSVGESRVDLDTNILCALMRLYLPEQVVLRNKSEMLKCTALEDRISLCLNVVPKSHPSYEYVFNFCLNCCRRAKAHIDYDPKFPKLKSTVKLIKAKQKLASGFAEDYGLSAFFEKVEQVEEFEGGHMSVLKNPKVVQTINKFIRDGIHIDQ